MTEPTANVSWRDLMPKPLPKPWSMPMTLEDLFKSWEADAPINDTEPAKELLRIPNLHQKYTRQLVLHNLTIKAQFNTFHTLRKIKTDYYSGRLDQAELTRLGWEPFRFVLKNDISLYLDADTDLQFVRNKISVHEEAKNLCEMIVKELNSRTYQLRSYMDWQKFVSGQ